MEFHPVSSLFPLMSGEEFEALVADIKANGLQESIWTHEGQIIDGRNRYKACVQAGVTPSFRVWEGKGSLVQFVVSLNLKRRHLTSSQKAMVAVNMLPLLEKEREEQRRRFATERPRTETGNFEPVVPKVAPLGKSRDEAARVTGVSHGYISDAKAIAEKAPDLIQPVLSGEIKMPEAKQLAELPQEQRAEVLGQPPEMRKMAVHYSSERMDWETPRDFFDRLDQEFEFELDVCATPETAKCQRYYTPETDGLARNWTGTCWMNPPYGSEIADWMEKAYNESLNGATVVCLVPSRTDTNWWHNYAMKASEIRFVWGRLRFGGAETSAPFPSAVIIMRPDNVGPPQISGVRANG